jgi:hypothetical protein
LYDASFRGDTAIVKVLLAAPGVNANIPRSVGVKRLEVCGPFRQETTLPRCTLLEMMPSCGAVYSGQDGTTPLLAAVKGSHDASVKALLEARADVNTVSLVRASLLKSCFGW